MAVEVTDGLEWIGIVDWGLRRFHGHELSTHRGSTYNSYLLRDEKNVLIDTVWGPFEEEWMETLEEAIVALAVASGGPEMELPVPVEEGGGLTETRTWPKDALDLLDEAEARLREGDWTGFGERLGELRTLLRNLSGTSGGG